MIWFIYIVKVSWSPTGCPQSMSRSEALSSKKWGHLRQQQLIAIILTGLSARSPAPWPPLFQTCFTFSKCLLRACCDTVATLHGALVSCQHCAGSWEDTVGHVRSLFCSAQSLPCFATVPLFLLHALYKPTRHWKERIILLDHLRTLIYRRHHSSSSAALHTQCLIVSRNWEDWCWPTSGDFL